MCNFFPIFRFQITEGGTHAGVVLFSGGTYVKMTIKLDDYFDTASFNRAVMNLKHYGYTTRIDKGLKVVERDLFNVKNGRHSFNTLFKVWIISVWM